MSFGGFGCGFGGFGGGMQNKPWGPMRAFIGRICDASGCKSRACAHVISQKDNADHFVCDRHRGPKDTVLFSWSALSQNTYQVTAYIPGMGPSLIWKATLSPTKETWETYDPTSNNLVVRHELEFEVGASAMSTMQTYGGGGHIVSTAEVVDTATPVERSPSAELMTPSEITIQRERIVRRSTKSATKAKAVDLPISSKSRLGTRGRRSFYIAAAAVLIVLFGWFYLSPKKEYFPLQEGMRWTYEISIPELEPYDFVQKIEIASGRGFQDTRRFVPLTEMEKEKKQKFILVMKITRKILGEPAQASTAFDLEIEKDDLHIFSRSDKVQIRLIREKNDDFTGYLCSWEQRMKFMVITDPCAICATL